MADYNSNYTGAEVDAAIAKTQSLESATDINNAVAPTSAAAGDVWTADGAGGAAWVTPSGGGGSQLYAHTVIIAKNSSYFILRFISSDSSYTNAGDMREKLYTKGFTSYQGKSLIATGNHASGAIEPDTTTDFYVTGIYASQTTIYVSGSNTSNSYRNLDLVVTSVTTFVDNVVAL